MTVSAAADALTALRGHGWQLGVAESLTGGLLTSAFVEVPGASQTLRGGIVAYATDLKHALLGVDAALLAARGAVDPDVALAMAAGVRVAVARDGAPVDVGIATTGVAGPDPQDGAPVGRVYIAVVTPDIRKVERLDLEGDRDQIRRAATVAAVRLLSVSL